MNIITSYDPKPIPLRQFDWSAIDADSYDGASDSSNRNQIGFGRTKEKAVEALKEILKDRLST